MAEQLAPAQEYKSVYREFKPGDEYTDCGEYLKPYQVDGWELFTVAWVKGVYQSEGFEVFYLRRAFTGPAVTPVTAASTASASGAGT